MVVKTLLKARIYQLMCYFDTQLMLNRTFLLISPLLDPIFLLISLASLTTPCVFHANRWLVIAFACRETLFLEAYLVPLFSSFLYKGHIRDHSTHFKPIFLEAIKTKKKVHDFKIDVKCSRKGEIMNVYQLCSRDSHKHM